jgi:hypothetical protein
LPEAAASDPPWSTPGRVILFLDLICYGNAMQLKSILITLLFISFAAAASDTPPVADAETEYVVSSPVPTDFKPSDRDIDEAILAFDAFHNFRDRDQMSEAYAMLTPANQQATSFEDWKQSQKSLLQEYGTDATRQVFRISWYPNPPSAPEPGLYVALDFASVTLTGGFRCGYVVLQKKANDMISVARTDETRIPKSMANGKTPGTEITEKLPCYLGKNTKTAFPAAGN